jgi:GNAT superfamily N-acetyltransferase
MPQIYPRALLGDDAELNTQIETVFFESSARKEFSSPQARAAFHELWLGRYLRHCAQDFFVALDDDSKVAGYLAGSLYSNEYPMVGPDIYALFPAGLLAAYPAHIHVNVRKDARGQGIGALLIVAFVHHCRMHSAHGFHAITSANSRSAHFFERCGLLDVADAEWNNRQIVMLGRRLD